MTDLAAILDEVASHPDNLAATARGWRPIAVGSPSSRILIASQAPGRLAQESGVAFQDPSGRLLRAWLGIDEQQFYDVANVAIVPMDFYFPGKGASGDLPPRRGFAERWHPRILPLLANVRLTIVIGAHAQRYHLGARAGRTLTETVRAATTYLPCFPIVHPSPLARGWRSANPWFEAETVPQLRTLVAAALDG